MFKVDGLLIPVLVAPAWHCMSLGLKEVLQEITLDVIIAKWIKFQEYHLFLHVGDFRTVPEDKVNASTVKPCWPYGTQGRSKLGESMVSVVSTWSARGRHVVGVVGAKNRIYIESMAKNRRGTLWAGFF